MSALCLIVWIACLAVPGALLIVLAVLLSAPVASAAIAAVIVCALIFAFWRVHRASGIAMTLGLVTVCLLCWPAQPSKSPVAYMADLARVAYYREELRRICESARLRGISPPLGVIAVDGFGSITSGVAYDPSRELSLDPARRSAAWNAAAARTELALEGLQARRIVGAYYTWSHF